MASKQGDRSVVGMAPRCVQGCCASSSPSLRPFPPFSSPFPPPWQSQSGAGKRGRPTYLPEAKPGSGGVRSPGLSGSGEDAGQRGQRRRGLAAPLQSVDQDARDQRPLERRRGRAGSPVQVERSAGIQVGDQTLRVEIGRREHPLQGGVVARLGQQLQPHRRLPLPLGPGGGKRGNGVQMEEEEEEGNFVAL